MSIPRRSRVSSVSTRPSTSDSFDDIEYRLCSECSPCTDHELEEICESAQSICQDCGDPIPYTTDKVKRCDPCWVIGIKSGRIQTGKRRCKRVSPAPSLKGEVIFLCDYCRQPMEHDLGRSLEQWCLECEAWWTKHFPPGDGANAQIFPSRHTQVQVDNVGAMEPSKGVQVRQAAAETVPQDATVSLKLDACSRVKSLVLTLS